MNGEPAGDTVSVELTFDELAKLRSGLTAEAQDAAQKAAVKYGGAVDSRLDAKLYSGQVILKSREYDKERGGE